MLCGHVHDICFFLANLPFQTHNPTQPMGQPSPWTTLVDLAIILLFRPH